MARQETLVIPLSEVGGTCTFTVGPCAYQLRRGEDLWLLDPGGHAFVTMADAMDYAIEESAWPD